jgi:hypothetical protein
MESDTDPTGDDTDPTMGNKLDVGEGSTGGPPTGETDNDCASVSETAMVGLQPTDIIFVVDNSGSMQFEANAVQQNLNAFSSQIFLADVDAHVVLLSAYLANDDEGICVDAPLGSGMCPADDNNPPGFTHIDISIDSTDALQRLLEQYPNFEGVLRPNASKHVIVVSDDNSDLSADNFKSMFEALDMANVGFTFHGIVADADPIFSCLEDPPDNVCCAISAAPGREYLELILDTGGVFGNLCEQDFQPIFDEVATQVVEGATLSCEFVIPPPPEGEDFDPDKVNVDFDDGGAGGPLPIGRVDSAADCAGVEHGWYYDNPADPQTIVVCDQTCALFQGVEEATVEIVFGCETVIAPPVG